MDTDIGLPDLGLPDLGLLEKLKERLHSYYRIKVKLHHNPSGYFDTYSFVHFSFGCLCRYLNINIYLFLLIIIVWEIVEHNIIFPNMFHQIKIHNIATDFGEYQTFPWHWQWNSPFHKAP